MLVKVKTFRVPNLDREDGGYDIDQMEEDIENHIKNKLENGYTLSGSIGGDAFLLLIFTKEAA